MIKTDKLSNYVEILSGFAFESKLFNDENNGMPLIRIRDVGKNVSKTFYPGDYDKKFIVKNGDYLLGIDGDFRLSEWKGTEALLNQRVCKISVVKSNELVKQYLLFFLPKELKLIEDSTSFATVKHLSVDKIKNIQIPLPPLSTQQKIAAILDAADELRQKDKALVAKYDELTQALFLDMFGDPVTNPKGWEKIKFEKVGKLDRGKSKHRPRNEPKLLGGKYPLIQTGDIANCGGNITEYKSTYSEFGLAQSKLWKSGTLCITIAANIAKTGILTFDACFPDSVVGFIPNEKTNTIYTQYWMSFLQKIIEGAAPESAQKNINLEILRDLDFMLAPIKLQNQFAERVKAIEEQKSIAQASALKSEELFNSLLQKAFNGELV